MTSRPHHRFLPNLLVAACLLGLAACAPASNDTDENAASQADAAAAQTPPAESTPPMKDAPPADEASPTTPPASDNLSKWQGYGDTTFGMDEAAFRKAWQGELSDYEFEDKASCYHLWPKGQKTSAELAFMFGDGKFARYSTENPRLTAPGGGKIGMTREEIEALYPGRVQAQPHKYTDGQYLRITQGNDVLLFETDGAGKVTEWRVGVPPEVDFVEGCA